MVSTSKNSIVKSLLFVDSKGALLHHNKSVTRLADTPFSRWFIAAHYPQTYAASTEAATWLAKYDPRRFVKPKGLKSDPLPHQILSINRMTLSNNAEWLDMGLGKTFICLVWALREHKRGHGSRFLTICPTSVFVSWEDEIEKHFDPAFPRNVVVAHGAKKKRALASIKTSSPDVFTLIITSYETLGAITDELRSLNLRGIFFDESSKIKNLTAKRTQIAHKFIEAQPKTRRFCLSGTPSTTNPLGFFSQYEILGKGFSGSPDFASYSAKYSDSRLFLRARLPSGKIIHVMTDPDRNYAEQLLTRWLQRNRNENGVPWYELGYTFAWKATKQQPKIIQMLNHYNRVLGTKNIPALTQISLTHSHCLYKEDVLHDLPDRTFVTRKVKLPNEQLKAYAEILENNKTELHGQKFNFGNRSGPHAKLHQIAQSFLLDQDKTYFFSKDPKLDELDLILEESGEQKVVVWCAWRPQIQAVCTHLKKRKINFREIHGGVPVKKRPEVIRAFSGENPPRVLVANPDVAGMGLNMVWATVTVFMSIWCKPDVYKQAIDRLYRIGQKNAVTVINLIAQGTLDPALFRNARNQINLEQTILTGKQLKGE